MNAQRPSLLPSILAGAGSAVLVLLGYAWVTADDRPNPEQTFAATNAQAGDTADHAAASTAKEQERLAQLERQVALLAKAADPDDAAPTPPVRELDAVSDVAETPRDSSAPELNLEEARRQALQDWEQKRASYQLEPIDERWATNTSEMFRADVSTLGSERGFSVIESDCRTQRCAVVIEWPSFEAAVDGFTALLHHDYQANCARETLLPDPEPAAAGAPYQATVIFDCSDWRQKS